jgi:hypothetical protein
MVFIADLAFVFAKVDAVFSVVVVSSALPAKRLGVGV